MSNVIPFPIRKIIGSHKKVLAQEVELVLRLSSPSPALQGKAEFALATQEDGLCAFSHKDIQAFERELISFTEL